MSFFYISVGLICNETFDLISSPRYAVPDSSFTASSKWDSSNRLDSSDCWMGDRDVQATWIKVDLCQPRIVTAIRTKGCYGTYYVMRFTLSTSLDDINWSTIKANNEDVVFEGHTDYTRYKVVANNLPAPIKTRFVRLNVIRSSAYIPGLKWAIDGCPV